jgi:hypothetical protein
MSGPINRVIMVSGTAYGIGRDVVNDLRADGPMCRPACGPVLWSNPKRLPTSVRRGLRVHSYATIAYH